jgi:hypothetical protein
MGGPEGWDPDVEPEGNVDKHIRVLNKDAYLANIFADADDMFVKTLFVRKRGKPRHHTVNAEPARENRPTTLSDEAGTAAANICRHLCDGKVEPDQLLKQVQEAVEILKANVPDFRSDQPRWTACLEQ